jgi:hypothetical protein
MAEHSGKGETSLLPISSWQGPRMTDDAPILPPIATPFDAPVRRDGRFLATVAVSGVLHLLVLGWLLMPPASPREPEPPPAVNVDLVPPPRAPSSLELSLSSEVPQPSSAETPSSEDLPSSDASASDGAPSAEQAPPSGASASEEPAASAEAASSGASAEEPVSAAEGSSAAEPSSAEPASTEPPSGESPSPPDSSVAAASEPPASQPPAPRSRPLIIPVGPSAASSAETASAPDASNETSVLATTGPDPGGAVDQASGEAVPTPPAADLLHAAKRFYSADMLDAPALAKVRAALKTLPPEKRVAQTCNIEAIGQIGNAGKGFSPDAVVANAFAKAEVTASSYTVSNGAFRSGKTWHAVAYTCTLSDDLGAITSFAFHIGGDVTAAMQARAGGG